jgi:hypothetical protein
VAILPAVDRSAEINRPNWDERAPAHAASPDYARQQFIDDPSFLNAVVRFDLPLLGNIRELRGVHLHCHIGTDTISLARLGATTTSVDFSPASVAEARRLSDVGVAVGGGRRRAAGAGWPPVHPRGASDACGAWRAPHPAGLRARLSEEGPGQRVSRAFLSIWRSCGAAPDGPALGRFRFSSHRSRPVWTAQIAEAVVREMRGFSVQSWHGRRCVRASARLGSFPPSSRLAARCSAAELLTELGAADLAADGLG